LKPIQIFISYERSDLEIAQRLRNTLPQDSFETLLDTNFLSGGDDWHSEIKERIRESDYFLVLNSSNLAAKTEGYVNTEIAIALNRQTDFAAGIKFIIPIRVENFDPEQGNRDLKAFHQIPLRRTTFEQDVDVVAKTILRDQQLRARERSAPN
jgi:TIR domain